MTFASLLGKKKKHKRTKNGDSQYCTYREM